MDLRGKNKEQLAQKVLLSGVNCYKAQTSGEGVGNE